MGLGETPEPGRLAAAGAGRTRIGRTAGPASLDTTRQVQRFSNLPTRARDASITWCKDTVGVVLGRLSWAGRG